MATPTYDLLDSVTLSSSSSSVTFSSIDQSYRDLILVSSINASATSYFYLRFNSDSSSSYSTVNMGGDGGATNSFATTATQSYLNFYQSASTTEPNGSITQIMDYSQTDKHKSVLVRNNTASKVVEARASRWANTAAITSLSVTASTGNFTAGSTFYLYGVAA